MNSAQVSVSDVATAAQYNNLRKDVVVMAGDYATSTGSSNAYLLTISDQFALAAGSTVKFKANFANTGAATLNVTPSGGAATGVKDIKNPNGSNLASGQIPNDGTVFLIYDGTSYIFVGSTSAGLTQALTDGASVAWDASAGNFASLAIGGNRTLVNPTNLSNQALMRLIVTQDTVGSRTLTYGTAYFFDGGGSIALSIAPLIVDVLDFQSDGTKVYCTNIARFGSTRCYFSGGKTTTAGAQITATQSLDMNSDTTAMVTKGALGTARSAGGSYNSATVGYFTGGVTNGAIAVTRTEGLSFATDTTTQVTKGSLLTARDTGGSAHSATVGYFAGGGTNVVTTEGLVFSTDTTTQTTKGALTQARAAIMAGGNSTTIGYFSGGDTGAKVTTTDGLTFATDTTTQVTKGVLSTAKSDVGANNSSLKAYFAGGLTGADVNVATATSLTFSTDTTTQVTAGALSVARSKLMGAGSLSIGYFTGGTTGNPVATTDALTFATDTVAQVTRASLTTVAMQASSVQGNSFATSQLI